VWVDDHLTAAREAITMRPMVILLAQHGAAGIPPKSRTARRADQKGWRHDEHRAASASLVGAAPAAAAGRGPAHVRLRP
jgi:hypothetical protein